MRLYATTTSERASKGQGGEYLSINIQDENKVTFAQFLIQKEFSKALPVIRMYSNGEVIHYQKREEGNALNELIRGLTKGNKQKDESKYLVCSWCGRNPPQSKLSEYCSEKCRYEATGKK